MAKNLREETVYSIVGLGTFQMEMGASGLLTGVSRSSVTQLKLCGVGPLQGVRPHRLHWLKAGIGIS